MSPTDALSETFSTGALADRPSRDAAAVGLGALFAALVAVSLWAAAVAVAVRPVAGLLPGHASLVVVTATASLVGLGVGALACARLFGLDIGGRLPRRNPAGALGVALAPAALAGCVALLGNALFGVTLSAATTRWLAPGTSAWTFLLTVVVPSAFLGVGYALLFCGVVYERARDLLGGDAAFVAATLSGFFWLLPLDPVARFSVGGAVELALSLVFGVAVAAALGVLAADTGSVPDLAPRHVAVLFVAALGVFGVATDLAAFPRAVGDLLWVAALALAVVGYARTRSVWVAALSLALFRVAVVAAVLVEASLGLAVAPA